VSFLLQTADIVKTTAIIEPDEFNSISTLSQDVSENISVISINEFLKNKTLESLDRLSQKWVMHIYTALGST